MMKSLNYVLVSTSIFLFSFLVHANARRDYQADLQNSLIKILQNLDHPSVAPGAIIASPSRQDPDYFFHWTRDAGLTVLTLTQQLKQNPHLATPIERWGRFERYAQSQSHLAGGTGLGEPKFLVDGSPFIGPWGRPQNDGPAIRSLAYLNAFHKIDRFVESDILYTLETWQHPSFDLWEEVKGHHFFTRYAQMASLRYAAVHYQAGLHTKNAKALFNEAAKIEKSLHAFISPTLNVVTPTLPGFEGVAKYQGLDISVLLALNYFGTTAQPSLNVEPDWSYSQPNMLFTAYRINEVFRNLYPINQKFSLMAPGIGRYPEDVYDGNGFSGGHPWFLATFGMAEYYCALIVELIEKGHLNLDPLSRAFYSHVNPQAGFAQSGRTNSAQGDYVSTLQALQLQAESFMQRAVFHGGGDGHFSEQFDRNSGYRRGASDLTWSYASQIRSINRCQASSLRLQKLSR